MLKNLSHISKFSFKTPTLNPKSFSIDQRKNPGKENIVHDIVYTDNPVFIGRKAELSQLLKNHKNLPSDKNQISISCISGDAGIGKSRLIKEFIKKINIKSKDYVQIKCIKESSDFDFLNSLISSISKKNTRSDIFNLHKNEKNESDLKLKIKMFLKKEIEEYGEKIKKHSGNLLIIIDDIQWIDEASFEFFDFIIYTFNLSRNFKTNLIISGRSFSHQVSSVVNKYNSAFYKLEPLAYTDSEKLLSKLLSINNKKDSKIVKTIINYSEGNPFAISEYASSLARGNISPESLTLNLKRLFDDKIKKLNERQQNLLLIISNIGKIFSLSFLNHISVKVFKEKTNSFMKALFAEGIIVESLNAGGHTDKYQFRHDIVYDYVRNYFKNTNNRFLINFIAESYEEFYSDSKHEHYKKIWELYKTAGNRAKTKHYTLKLIDNALSNYLYKDVLFYMDYLKSNFELSIDEKKILIGQQVKAFTSLYKKNEAVALLLHEIKHLHKTLMRRCMPICFCVTWN